MLDVVDAGDVDIVPAWPERGHAVTYQRVGQVMASGAVPVILGGDHSITWPVLSAVVDALGPGRVSIIDFDAHADTADDESGVRAGHGTPMRRLIEAGVIDGRVSTPGRAAWLLAAAACVPLDADRGHALAPHDGDRGPRHRRRIEDAIAEASERAELVYVVAIAMSIRRRPHGIPPSPVG